MGYSLELTQDGGFIIVGFTDSYGAGNKDVFIVTDSNGDSLWTRTFGDTTDDIGYSVAAISNGDFIIAGESNYLGYLIRLNSYGDTLWTNH